MTETGKRRAIGFGRENEFIDNEKAPDFRGLFIVFCAAQWMLSFFSRSSR